MNTVLRSASVLAFVAAALSASAALVDFENLSNKGDTDYPYVTSQGASVVSGGFLFVSGDDAEFGSVTSAGTGGGFDYTGSVALFNGTGSSTTMTRVDGAPFTLSSMQLANVFVSGVIQGSTIDFIGRQVGGGTVTSRFTVVKGDALQTTTFSGFANLLSVSWTDPFPYHQFDNIVVNATPEPATFAALGLGAVAFVKRRKRA